MADESAPPHFFEVNSRTSAHDLRHIRQQAMTHALKLVSIYPSEIHDIRSFIADIESAQVECGLDWDGMLGVVQRRLHGPARNWFDNTKFELTTFDIFASRFKQQFGRTAAELIAVLNRMTMHPEEDVRVYSDRFLSCMNEIGLRDDDPMVLESYLRGLGSHSFYARITPGVDSVTKAQAIAIQNQATLRLTGGSFIGAQPHWPAANRHLGRQQDRRYPAASPEDGYDGSFRNSRNQWDDPRPSYRSQPVRWANEPQRYQPPPAQPSSHAPPLRQYQGNPPSVPPTSGGPPRQAPLVHPWGNRSETTNNPPHNVGRPSAPPPSQNTMDALARQMEELKIKMNRQAPGNQGYDPPMRTHMMQVQDGGSPSSVYAVPSATRPRNLEQLPTFDDVAMTENRAPPTVRKAPAVGPRRAEEVPSLAAIDQAKKLLESRKYIVSFKDMIMTGNNQFHRTVANEFNRLVAVSEQQQASNSVNHTTSATPNVTPRKVHFGSSMTAPPSQPPRSNRNDLALAVSAAEKPGMVEIEVYVNKHPVRAFIDTGAEHCVINRPVAAQCGLLTRLDQSTSVLCQGVSGDPVRSEGSVTALIELGRASTRLNLVVMNTPNASFQLLLGSDWCDIFQVQILFASNNLILDIGSGEQLRVPFQRSNRRHSFHFTEVQEAMDESGPSTDPYALYRLDDGSICYEAMAADDAASYTSSQYSRMTDEAVGNAENVPPTSESQNVADLTELDEFLVPAPYLPDVEDMALVSFSKLEAALSDSTTPPVSNSPVKSQRNRLIRMIEDPAPYQAESPPVKVRDSSELSIPQRLCYNGVIPEFPLTAPISSILSELAALDDANFLNLYNHQRFAFWEGDSSIPWDRWFRIRSAQIDELAAAMTPEVWSRDSPMFPPEVLIYHDEHKLFEREMEEYFHYMTHLFSGSNLYKSRTVGNIPLEEAQSDSILVNTSRSPVHPYVSHRVPTSASNPEDDDMPELGSCSSSIVDPEENPAALLFSRIASAPIHDDEDDMPHMSWSDDDDDDLPDLLSGSDSESDETTEDESDDDEDDDDSLPDLVDTDTDDDDYDYGDNSDSDSMSDDHDQDEDDDPPDKDFYDNFSYEPDPEDHINYDVPSSAFHTANDHIKHSCPAVQIHPTDPSKFLIYVPGYPEPFVAGDAFPSDPALQNDFILHLFDYRDSFCVEISDLQVPCSILEAHLDTGQHPPVFTPSYRRPPTEERAFAELTRILVKNGIVEPSVSPWCSPGMAVSKKVDEDADPATLTIEQQWRHVVDYRNINAIAKSDPKKN